MPLWHGIAHRPQLGRHWDLDIGAAMRALDPNVTVFDVLWAKPNHLAAPRCRFECELHHEPLLRPQRPMGAVSFDLIVSPGVVPVALRQFDAHDACSWVILAQARHG